MFIGNQIFIMVCVFGLLRSMAAIDRKAETITKFQSGMNWGLNVLLLAAMNQADFMELCYIAVILMAVQGLPFMISSMLTKPLPALSESR
jgi:hypothetical protein